MTYIADQRPRTPGDQAKMRRHIPDEDRRRTLCGIEARYMTAVDGWSPYEPCGRCIHTLQMTREGLPRRRV